ncbi:MAG: hypothetical protein ACE5Q3_18905 [Alphaproteobacteria bacterium]
MLLAALGAFAVAAGTVPILDQQALAQIPIEEEEAFNRAVDDGSIEALQQFLILFPNSLLAEHIFELLNAGIASTTATAGGGGRLPSSAQIAETFAVESAYGN